MAGKILKHIWVTLFAVTLCFVSLEAFSKGDVKSGGDTSRNPVLGVNFIGGWGGFWGGEIEVDFKMGDSMSLAPRIGGAGFNTLDVGASLRFGIIDGKRPHGFWVGPSLDLLFDSANKWGGGTGGWGLYIVPAAEFGWRYTFDFGLSLQPLIRAGVWVNGNGLWFYLTGGWGIGYAF